MVLSYKSKNNYYGLIKRYYITGNPVILRQQKRVQGSFFSITHKKAGKEEVSFIVFYKSTTKVYNYSFWTRRTIVLCNIRYVQEVGTHII